MPEEPDLTPEDLEILDGNIRKRIEAKKQQRQEKQLTLIADRILEALQSRPEGMTWPEIRSMFDKNQSDEQIREALLTLTKTPLITNKVEKRGEHSGERFMLATG